MNKTTKRIVMGISAAVVGIIVIATAAFFLLRGNSWTQKDVDRVEDKYMRKSDANLVEEFGKPATVKKVDGAYINRTYKTWENTKLGKDEKVMLTLVDGKIYNITTGKQDELKGTMASDKVGDRLIESNVKKLTNLLDEYSDELNQLDDISVLNLGENGKYIVKGSDGKWTFDAKTFVDDLLK